jgi:8-oxo-dGTP diphosphatase
MNSEEKIDINSIPHTVTAIILNGENQVLAVSRKDDHTDFGLPGGKVESGESFINAINREVKEETGLDIDISTMTELLSMPKNMIGKSYWGHSFLIKDWSGNIGSDEPHVIKWTTFEELEKGCFGPWNTIAKDSLNAVGIKVI